MYLNHYNLKTEPFKITTDPEFLWLGEKHKEALATLKYGILGNKGILLLTGDVGTGKTTLIHALLNSLGEDTLVATVPDPGLDKMDFFNYVASAFNMQKTFYSKGEFTLYLSHFLKAANNENKKVVLIIDEAQRLNKDLLEEIRLLSNIELQNTKLINLFFVGQKEFNDIILLEENKALRQRISLRYHIEPLNLDETREYIKYRLGVAGSKNSIFNSDAVSEVYSFSKGYPRLINILCDYALLSGFVRDKKTVGRQIVKECAEELQIPEEARGAGKAVSRPDTEQGNSLAHQPLPEKNDTAQWPKAKGKKPPWSPIKKIGLGLVSALLMVGLVYYFYGGPKIQSSNLALRPLWQKVELQMNQISAWLKQENVEKQDEDRSISLPLSGKKGEAKPSQHEKAEIPKTSETLTKTHGPSMGETTDRVPVPRDMDSKHLESPRPRKSSETVSLPSVQDLPQVVQPVKEQVPEAQTSNQPLGVVYEKAFEPQSPIGTPLAEDTEQAQRMPNRKAVILFDSNSFELNGEAVSGLNKIVGYAKNNPGVEIVIKGYTDDSGPFVYNERLSIFRAYSVKSYLVEHGVDPMKAKAFGMGPRQPVDEGGNKIPVELTRSVEVEVYGK
jgi:general secretion pathway protein A